MNNFTKYELENILACIIAVCSSSTISEMNHGELKEKIQSMIDNYSQNQCNTIESHIECDGTPYQCNCYTRGQSDEFKVLTNEINFILEGKDDGTGFNYPEWGKIRRRLLELLNK